MMELQITLERFVGLAGVTLLHGTVLAAVTWAVCGTVLRKARPALHAALWTVVLVRFLVPPILPGEVSLSSWLVRVAPLTRSASTDWGEKLEPATAAEAGLLGSVAEAPSLQLEDRNLQMFLMLLYLVPFAMILRRSGADSIRLWRKVARLPQAHPEVAAEVEGLARGIGLKAGPRVKTTRENSTPFILGFWRATLVLPEKLLLELDPVSRRALIIHELAHVRRGDLLIRGLQNLAKTLLFFWPPVWWVCRRIERFAEMACDQWAVSVSSVSPNAYARSLLEIVKNISAPRLGQQELAFGRKGRLLEERFDMILKNQRSISPRLSWLMFPALTAWVGFALAGGSVNTALEEQDPPKVRKVQKLVVQAEGKGALPQELLEKFPEADTNQDGKLGFEELRLYLGAAAGGSGTSVICTMRDGEEPECNFTESLPEALFVGEMPLAREILERHPEADLDGDGELNPEELSRHFQEQGPDTRIVVKKRILEGTNGDQVVVHEDALEHEMPHAARRVKIRIDADNTAELAERFPEADLDGNGELSDEEMLQWREDLAGAGEDAHVAHHFEKRIHVEVDSAGDSQDETFVWVNEDEGGVVKLQIKGVSQEMDADGDGVVSEEEIRAFVESRHGQGEHRLMFVREEASSDRSPELTEADLEARHARMAEERRRQLLEKNPEADLDGDGILSKEEAQALAVQLQETRKALKQKKNP